MENFSCIRVSGTQATDFLQGQLTCDLMPLQPGDSTPAAYCDNKGRMLANFWLFRQADDFLLWLSNELVETTLITLQRYGVFSKVTITAETGWHTDVVMANAPPEATLITALPGENRYLCLNPTALSCATLEDNAWALSNIEANCLWLRKATQLKYTPQMIGWEKIGGVSFTKGCYLGQEVVARTQHLGKLKRHLQRLRVSTTASLTIGDPILDTTGQPIGLVGEAAIDGGTQQLLAVLPDTARNTTLTLHGQPVTWMD